MRLCHGNFTKAGKRKPPCCWWGKNALTRKHYTSFALLVGILEVDVDCATTHLALKQKMPDRFPHLQLSTRPIQRTHLFMTHHGRGDE
jgi:hypothetical protein